MLTGASTDGDERRIGRALLRIRRHWHWARTQGLGRLIEEDRLDPRPRLRRWIGRWLFRRRSPVPAGTAVPVFVMGVQRSGTNMLLRALEEDPSVEIYNENNRRAFRHFNLRSDERVVKLIERSRHRIVVFKPLCDSHRATELLRLGDQPGRGLWVYRNFDSQVRSNVAKFGDNALVVFSEIAAGSGNERWQAQRLSDDTLRFLRSFDFDAMTPETASALFWYARNRLFFEIGLDGRDDVRLVSYDRLIAEPAATMRSVCDFVGVSYSPALVADVDGQRSRVRPQVLEIDQRAREACRLLEARLDELAIPAAT